VLDEHSQAGLRLVRLAGRLFEGRPGRVEAAEEHEAGTDDHAERRGGKRDRRDRELWHGAGNASGEFPGRIRG